MYNIINTEKLEQIIKETVKEINIDDFYFLERNRKWQPMTVKMEPIELSEANPISYLQSLGILNTDGSISPLLKDAGFFISMEVMNDEIGQYVPRSEILVSTLGIKFLKSMNTKLFMQKGGFVNG